MTCDTAEIPGAKPAKPPRRVRTGAGPTTRLRPLHVGLSKTGQKETPQENREQQSAITKDRAEAPAYFSTFIHRSFQNIFH